MLLLFSVFQHFDIKKEKKGKKTSSNMSVVKSA